jgi:uncharacterized LabA/DUF88 family protein
LRQIESDAIERLGSDGLARVLGDVLDKNRLVRLATACGVSYPGLRTRSQKRERIIADLVKRASAEDSSRNAIYRVLSKETAGAARSWARLDPAERTRHLQDDDYLFADGNLGRHLFLLARRPSDDDADTELARLCSKRYLGRAAKPGSVAAGELGRVQKENARLKKQAGELRNKILHLEGQVAKAKEAERAAKKDLLERKGELAESRMLAEKLRRELEQARAKPATMDPAALEKLTRAVRRVTTEQRKLTHSLTQQTPTDTLLQELRGPTRERLDELERVTTRMRSELTRAHKQLAERDDGLRNELKKVRTTAARNKRPATARRARGGHDRVGMFVDVQNVYYAARQLKGKLDFDALLQSAVRDRRLIQATAYVVETKEIDQSGFIGLLQQRAITVRRKNLKVRADRSMKGDWDMEMALDILDAAAQLDVVVLVSGDGDFTSLVKRVKAMGPRVEVVAFPRNTAKSLVEAADDFQPLGREFMIRTEERKQAKKETKAVKKTD